MRLLVHSQNVRKVYNGIHCLLLFLSILTVIVSSWVLANFHYMEDRWKIDPPHIQPPSRGLDLSACLTVILTVFLLITSHFDLQASSLCVQIIVYSVLLIFWSGSIGSLTGLLGSHAMSCSLVGTFVSGCRMINAELAFGWTCWLIIFILVLSETGFLIALYLNKEGASTFNFGLVRLLMMKLPPPPPLPAEVPAPSPAGRGWEFPSILCWRSEPPIQQLTQAARPPSPKAESDVGSVV